MSRWVTSGWSHASLLPPAFVPACLRIPFVDTTADSKLVITLLNPIFSRAQPAAQIDQFASSCPTRWLTRQCINKCKNAGPICSSPFVLRSTFSLFMGMKVACLAFPKMRDEEFFPQGPAPDPENVQFDHHAAPFMTFGRISCMDSQHVASATYTGRTSRLAHARSCPAFWHPVVNPTGMLFLLT